MSSTNSEEKSKSIQGIYFNIQLTTIYLYMYIYICTVLRIRNIIVYMYRNRM